MNEQEKTMSVEEARIAEEAERAKEEARVALLPGIQELLKYEDVFHELMEYIKLSGNGNDIERKYAPWETVYKLNKKIEEIILDCSEKYTGERIKTWYY